MTGLLPRLSRTKSLKSLAFHSKLIFETLFDQIELSVSLPSHFILRGEVIYSSLV